jgi:hypothetical protein
MNISMFEITVMIQTHVCTVLYIITKNYIKNFTNLLYKLDSRSPFFLLFFP